MSLSLYIYTHACSTVNHIVYGEQYIIQQNNSNDNSVLDNRVLLYSQLKIIAVMLSRRCFIGSMLTFVSYMTYYLLSTTLITIVGMPIGCMQSIGLRSFLDLNLYS